MSDLNSQLMIGWVQHRRLSPVHHKLNYPLFMPNLDLDEIEHLERKVWGFGTKWWHWARFNRKDYLGVGSLKVAIQEKVFELTGERVTGQVKAICHLRYLGVYFSPVNFYYLYDNDGNWQYMLAEVSNTPWNERHYYAIPAEPGFNNQNWTHDKTFHVSPFNPIDQKYVWRLKPLKNNLLVHLECHRGGKEFDATLSMKAHALTSQNLIKQLIKTPVMAVKVTIGIYWHALKLWIKGAPFYSHSKYSSTVGNEKNKQSRRTDANIKNNNQKGNSTC